MHRTLNFADLTLAYQLEVDELNRRAARPVADLSAIRPITPGQLDPAGVPYRGGSVFTDTLDSHYSIDELAAAYVWLRNRNAQSALIHALETAIPA